MNTARGQATVEFAVVCVALLGMLFALIDLARAGFTQHELDTGVGDLAHALAVINSINSSGQTYVLGDPSTYAPTPLNPVGTTPTIYLGQTMPVSQAIQQALTEASGLSGGLISAAPLAMSGATTLSNGQIAVVATPDLTNTSTLTVTMSYTFVPVTGLFLGHKTIHLPSSEAAIPSPS